MMKKALFSALLLIPFSLPALAGSGGNTGSGNWSDPDDLVYFRIDCRYHGSDKNNSSSSSSDHDRNDKGDKTDKGEKGERGSAPFCYGSAVYRIDDSEFKDVHLAVGCENRTLFNDDARVHVEMTLDRFQPNRSATPAIEVFPHGQLTTEGTYTSVLDISLGRFQGLCYVHKIKYEVPTKKP